jgi:fructose-bisphosphate aldolase/2-amino-3,7-dideoxy-D-threo-hept-6-ulosonate synthase
VKDLFSTGKYIRLKNFLKDDNRVFVVAMDHGVVGITDGIENMGKVIDTVTKSGADAVMINVGMVHNYQERIGGRIGLIATIESRALDVEQAVKVGASAVKTTYAGKVPVDGGLRQEIILTASKCEEWGMPYMAEVIPADSAGEFLYDFDLVLRAARIAAELGGDMVKTSYTGSSATFRKVVEACPIPIVIAGGPKIENDEETLGMVKGVIEAGGAGVVFGRNVWQHKEPAKMTEAIAKIIHQDITVHEALKVLK